MIESFIKEKIKEIGSDKFLEELNNDNGELKDKIFDLVKETVKLKTKPEKIESINDLALLLDGNECGDELKNIRNIDVIKLCKENKWIICFPYSDDNLEIRGFIEDELGALDDSYYKIINPGEFYKINNDRYDDEDIYKKSKNYTVIDSDEEDCDIIMKWSPKNSEASWAIECNTYNSAKFNIYEDDELFAECLVINLN